MDLKDVLALLQTASILLGIVVAAGTIRGRENDKTANLAEMRSDIKYIKEKVDGMKDIPDRIARVEESTKSAHKRLDEHIKMDH